jgi:hypothetical protein
LNPGFQGRRLAVLADLSRRSLLSIAKTDPRSKPWQRALPFRQKAHFTSSEYRFHDTAAIGIFIPSVEMRQQRGFLGPRDGIGAGSEGSGAQQAVADPDTWKKPLTGFSGRSEARS